MIEWIRFFCVAVLLLTGIAAFVTEVLGLLRFGFVMNRMHAVGVGDSFGLLFVIAAMILSSGPGAAALKLFLLILFMWLTSPVSTHLLGRIEMNTNPFIERHVRREVRERREERI